MVLTVVVYYVTETCNSKAIKKQRHADEIMEIMYLIKVKIFREDRLGLNAYIQARRVMQSWKVQDGIQKWDEAQQTINSYLPEYPWDIQHHYQYAK